MAERNDPLARAIAGRVAYLTRLLIACDVKHHSEANLSESDRQFDVELFIVHPTIDPSEITAALGLEAAGTHRVGDRRMTPRGTLLEGNYPDTRWRHSSRYTTSNQWFADKVESLVVKLLPHRAFLSRLLQTGGRLSLIVQFLGDGYFGDEIPQSTLAKIADLGLSLGIECFIDPQSDSPELSNKGEVDG